MLLDELRDAIIRLPEGAVVSSRNRWDMAYIDTLINTTRGELVRIKYNGNRQIGANTRINPSYYLKFYPEYSKLLQESDCFNKFIVPAVISLKDVADGFSYVGTVDNSLAFKRIKDRADLSNLNYLSKFRPSDGTFISYLWEVPYMEIYGQNVKEFLIVAVPQNPYDFPDWNPYVDPYPIDDSDIPELIKMIWDANTMPEIKVRPEQPQIR